MQKTIYVRDEDAKLFESAEKMGGGESLSSIITTALRQWLAANRAGRNRLDTIANRAVAYLDEVEEAPLSAIADALELDEQDRGDLPRALQRANRHARERIATYMRTNFWFEETYPQEDGGWWTLRFRSSADEPEEDE